MIILHKVILYTPAGLGTWAVQSRVEKSRTGRAGQGRRRPIEAIEVEATQGIREAWESSSLQKTRKRETGKK